MGWKKRKLGGGESCACLVWPAKEPDELITRKEGKARNQSMEARLEKDIMEAIAELLLKLDSHLQRIPSASAAHDQDHFRNRVTLNGTNIGASTTIHPSNSNGSDGRLSVNIYVNNNVQGVSNSILQGSRVSMRNPGATLHFSSCCNNRQDEKRWNNASEIIDEKSSALEKKGRKDSWSAQWTGVCCLLLIIALFKFFQTCLGHGIK